MTRIADMTDAGIERLLAGVSGAKDAGVAAFVSEMRAVFPEEPVAPEVEATHLAAVAAAVADLSTKASAAPVARRRPLRLVFRVALAAGSLLLLFCGLALAGALPSPIEGPLSRAALRFGVHLPDSVPSATPLQTRRPAVSPSAAAHPSPTTTPHGTVSPGTHKHKKHKHAASGSDGAGQKGRSPATNGSGSQSGDGNTSPVHQNEDGDAADKDSPETDQEPPETDQEPADDPTGSDETQEEGARAD